MNLWAPLDALMGYHWRTVGNNRCLLDRTGHIVKGPHDWEGIHVSRLPTHAAVVREIKAESCATIADPDLAHRSTFPNKAVPVAAILQSNPGLFDRMESEDGTTGDAYREWIANNQRGHKPQIPASDGRFDALNEQQDRKGMRRICCWLEAVYASLPSNRLWDDIDLRALSEAYGDDLHMPEPAELRAIARAGRAECIARVDKAIDDARARHAEKLEEAPF
jgi:hypothetical protein